MTHTDLQRRAWNQPPGTIVVPVADHLREVEFVVDLVNLTAGNVPPGTTLSIHRSGSVVENINNSLEDMLHTEGHEWAWIMGDDHRFTNDLLVQLLEHDKDIVVPLGVRRTPPFLLGIFSKEADFVDERLDRSYPGYLPYNADEVPDEPFKIIASGSAGMLIRRPVLEQLGFPYFESSDGVWLNEDLEFCRRVRSLGYDIWCDPHAYLGHIGTVTIWPSRLTSQETERAGRGTPGDLVVRLDHGGPPGINEVVLDARMDMVTAT